MIIIQYSPTGYVTNYLLQHVSPIANCAIRMNADKPVLLKPESEINNHKQLKVSIGKIVNSVVNQKTVG